MENWNWNKKNSIKKKSPIPISIWSSAQDATVGSPEDFFFFVMIFLLKLFHKISFFNWISKSETDYNENDE